MPFNDETKFQASFTDGTGGEMYNTPSEALSHALRDRKRARRIRVDQLARMQPEGFWYITPFTWSRTFTRAEAKAYIETHALKNTK